jgi:drug/metabolite transporter (DMT)-like permease
MGDIPKRNSPPGLVILAFATVYVVWGSTYFFILLALKGFPPMMLGAFRFFAAGLIMLGWSAFRGQRIFISKNIKNAAVSGTLMLFGGTGVVIWVEQVLPSALVAILVSASPFWFVLMDKPMWRVSFRSASTITGLVIGFIGIVLLFGEKLSEVFSGANVHREIGAMALILVGSFCWTAGSIYSKYRSTKGSNTVNVGWQMFVAGIPFALSSLLLGESKKFTWEVVPAEAWFSMGYLILFGSIAAYTAYVWLLQERPSAQVSTYAYVNPVVAVLLGVFFAAERITVFQVLGLVIILGSVLMINLAKYRSVIRNFPSKSPRK